MTNQTLEERVAALEERVSAMATQIASEPLKNGNGWVNGKPWWEAIRGMYKDDPDYDEAMRLGREWRESQRPAEEE